MIEPSTPDLVVCAGALSPESADLIATFHSGLGNCRFAMSEWLAPDELSRAAILWIVDDSEPWDPIRIALRNGIPMMVPETNLALKFICLNADCGLCYRDGPEALACLKFLLSDDISRVRMGANGRAYVI